MSILLNKTNGKLTGPLAPALTSWLLAKICSPASTCFKEEDQFKEELAQKYGEENADAIMEGRLKDVMFNIIYYPEINEYRGYRNIRVVVKRISWYTTKVKILYSGKLIGRLVYMKVTKTIINIGIS